MYEVNASRPYLDPGAESRNVMKCARPRSCTCCAIPSCRYVLPTGPSSHRSGDATENDATTPGARAAIGRHVTELSRRGRGQVTWQVPRSGRVRRATPRESARAATGARPMHEAPVASALRNSSRSRRRPGRTGGAGARRSDAALTIAARPCGCIPLSPVSPVCSVFGLGYGFYTVPARGAAGPVPRSAAGGGPRRPRRARGPGGSRCPGSNFDTAARSPQIGSTGRPGPLSGHRR